MNDPAGRVDLTEDRIDLTYSSTVAEFDLDRAVADLAQLRRCKEGLSMWESELSTWISDALGRNEIDVEGVGHVTVKHGADRKAWDKRELLRAVLDSRRPPSEDGEAHGSDDGQAFIGDELISTSPDLSRVLDCFNLPAPRVTALKDRGIPVDEFCETTPGKVSVIIE